MEAFVQDVNRSLIKDHGVDFVQEAVLGSEEKKKWDADLQAIGDLRRLIEGTKKGTVEFVALKKCKEYQEAYVLAYHGKGDASDVDSEVLDERFGNFDRIRKEIKEMSRFPKFNEAYENIKTKGTNRVNTWYEIT